MTPSQKSVYEVIRQSPGKSGAFWQDLGFSIVAIKNLERSGYVIGKSPDFFARTIRQKQWFVTDKKTRFPVDNSENIG